AERGVWVTLRVTSIYLIVLSLGYYFLAQPLVQAFVEEAEAVAFGIQSLQLFALGYVLFGVGMIPVQAFNGAGDTRTPTLINFICFWLIEIPLGYYLGKELGYAVEGVVGAVVIAEAILAALAVWLFKRGKWKGTEV
ncbi:MAG: MATE family efflux transporter, partial [Bacteroidota bacterium]